MNIFLLGTLTVIGALLVFAVLYWLVHYQLKFVNLGRIAAGVLVLGGTLLDQLNALPWGTILTDGQAKLVTFAVAAALMLKQAYDKASAPPEGK